MLNLTSFWKREVLPDKSILIGQKTVENAKIKQKLKWDILYLC